MSIPYQPPGRALTDDERNILYELRHEGMRKCESCGMWTPDDEPCEEGCDQ